jgi:ferredoxin
LINIDALNYLKSYGSISIYYYRRCWFLFYQQLMERFQQIVKNSDLEEEEVLITGRTLSAEEAIGNPMRRDFPIIKGKEKLMEAVFKGAKGQAFTDMPGDFRGQLQEVLAIKPENNFQRAVLISTMNAVLRYLGLIDRTVHCRNEDPELCSLELIQYIKQRFGHPRVALVGYQPAMLEEKELKAPEAKAFQTQVDYEGVAEKLKGMFEHPIWEDLSSNCQNCGICTYVCPSCHCFDIQVKSWGEEGYRFRCWDSCMYGEYTAEAGGGNPRPTTKERFRNRFLHKLEFFSERYGYPLCTGCGRCIVACPTGINIVNIINEVKEASVDV